MASDGLIHQGAGFREDGRVLELEQKKLLHMANRDGEEKKKPQKPFLLLSLVRFSWLIESGYT